MSTASAYLPPYGRRRESGFGLVELMISIVIGLVIIAALVALFLGTTRNNREMATANSVIENGRFALQLLEGDVVHAGFWGTFVPEFDDQTASDASEETPTPPAGVPAEVPDPCRPFNLGNDPDDWNAAYVSSLIGVPAQAYDANVPASCAGVVTNKVAGTDALVVRHVDTCVAGVGGCEGLIAGKLYFQSSLCAANATAFVLTPSVNGTPTAAADFPLTRRNCLALADQRKFVSNIYYVSMLQLPDANGIPRPTPTLMRSEFELGGVLAHQPPVALIEGIEALRVEFGVDSQSGTGEAIDYTSPIVWSDPETKRMATNRGDGVPDGVFVRCPCTVDQLMNVTAVRIHVLARSREPTAGYVDTKTYTLGNSPPLGPYRDGFKRHVYSTTVRLPNIAGRRVRAGGA